MVLRSIAHDDPEIEEVKDRISRYTKMVEPYGFTYQVYLNERDLVGIAFIGQEPMQLFRPIGTPLIRFLILDYDQPVEMLYAFADEVLNLAKAREVDFAYLNIPAGHDAIPKHLEQIGFQKLADRIELRRPLDEIFEVSDTLRYERVQREDLTQFAECMKAFMSGSQDAVLDLVLENLLSFPESLLDQWYKSIQAYFVYHDDKVVGILDIDPPTAGHINNIGVAPSHRGKGVGTEMLRFCLKLFKDAGAENASLGVNATNTPAIRVYEKLGFTVDEHVLTYIWWKNPAPS
jgi:ribosomal protein S18 acetylase RimI-like enzyme